MTSIIDDFASIGAFLAEIERGEESVSEPHRAKSNNSLNQITITLNGGEVRRSAHQIAQSVQAAMRQMQAKR